MESWVNIKYCKDATEFYRLERSSHVKNNNKNPPPIKHTTATAIFCSSPETAEGRILLMSGGGWLEKDAQPTKPG